MKHKSFWKYSTNVDRAFMFKFLQFLTKIKVARREANELWLYDIQGYKRSGK